MGKREFIDRSLLDIPSDDNEWEALIKFADDVACASTYTEQEIVKPYLEKIRSEILEEKECAYADFERYKVEYLGQDWEYVQDSLPQDDFGYGMERCVAIIDSLLTAQGKTESE